MKNGKNFEESFYLSTTISLEFFNKQIFSKINSKYKWLNLIKFPNFILVFAPILVILGFFIKKRRNILKIKQWKLEEELLETLDNFKDENENN